MLKVNGQIINNVKVNGQPMNVVRVNGTVVYNRNATGYIFNDITGDEMLAIIQTAVAQIYASLPGESYIALTESPENIKSYIQNAIGNYPIQYTWFNSSDFSEYGAEYTAIHDLPASICLILDDRRTGSAEAQDLISARSYLNILLLDYKDAGERVADRLINLQYESGTAIEGNYVIIGYQDSEEVLAIKQWLIDNGQIGEPDVYEAADIESLETLLTDGTLNGNQHLIITERDTGQNFMQAMARVGVSIDNFYTSMIAVNSEDEGGGLTGNYNFVYVYDKSGVVDGIVSIFGSQGVQQQHVGLLFYDIGGQRE